MVRAGMEYPWFSRYKCLMWLFTEKSRSPLWRSGATLRQRSPASLTSNHWRSLQSRSVRANVNRSLPPSNSSWHIPHDVTGGEDWPVWPELCPVWGSVRSVRAPASSAHLSRALRGRGKLRWVKREWEGGRNCFWHLKRCMNRTRFLLTAPPTNKTKYFCSNSMIKYSLREGTL